jgi:hypothetical protein
MPSWGEVLQEFTLSAQMRGGSADADEIRRKYLRALADTTKRSTIIYSTAWLNRGGLDVSINLQDMQGLMEVCRGLPGPCIDIVLHSPGGTAEAAASLVKYLRQKYTDIRVIVPLAAMSAATMWSLSADRIVMGKHSQLGPIDPQVSINGAPPMPARTILDQFDRAKKELAANPSLLPAWAPVISQYGPGLLEMCEKSEELAKGLVRDWLAEYMFRERSNATELAKQIAAFFGDYTLHKSHNIGIFRDQAKSVGLVIDNLEDDESLQDAVLSVHHATMLTFQSTMCLKLIENDLGRGFYVNGAPVVVQQFQMPPMQPPPTPQIHPPQGPSSH